MTRLTSLHFLRSERRRQFREHLAFMDSHPPESSPTPFWEQLEPLLDEGLAQLAPQDRQAIILRYFEEQDFEAVAAALRVHPAAAQKRVRRAVHKMRLFFARRGVAVPAAAMTARSIGVAPAGLARTTTASALAGAAGSASTLILAKGALKIMAWTKAQTVVATLAIAGLAIYSVMQRHADAQLRADDQLLRAQLAKSQAESDQLAAWRRQRQWHAEHPAAPPPAVPLLERLKGRNPKLTSQQLEAFLKKHGRDAASLLAAYRTSGDADLLKEAMSKFPGNPQVAFEAASNTNLPPAGRQQWLEAFEKSAPDNALANYLMAAADFKSGQTSNAVQALEAAAGKPLDDYTSERIEDDMEAYLAADIPLAEAKELATEQLLLPQLSQLRDLGLQTVSLAGNYTQAGDAESAAAALQSIIDLGQQYSAGAPGEPEISQLVGIALQSMALRSMDPSSPYGNGNGTVQDQLDALAQQRAALMQIDEQSSALWPQMTDDDWVVYKDRWLMYGEVNAQQWLISKYGSQ